MFLKGHTSRILYWNSLVLCTSLKLKTQQIRDKFNTSSIKTGYQRILQTWSHNVVWSTPRL